MNLYTIEQDLLELLNIFEEQGGEVTDEQLQRFNCTQEDFKEKLQNYYYYCKSIDNDIEQCKCEEKRIKEFRKVKENKFNRLKNIMLNAVKEFGDQQKNGVKVIEYPTFKLSTRKSSSITVDNERAETFVRLLRSYLDELDVAGLLDNSNKLSYEGMIGAINGIYRAEIIGEKGTDIDFIPFTIEDLYALDIDINMHVSFVNLFNTRALNNVLKSIVNPMVNVKPALDKSNLKNTIDNVTYAKAEENISLQMK